MSYISSSNFLTLLIFSKKIGFNVKIIVSIISILVAYSRIKLKVHSFNQVLVGIFLGIIYGSIYQLNYKLV